jgi:lipoprotein signal peptidase
MKNAFFLFSIAALATVDRLSKLWAEKNLAHGEIPVFGEFLRLKLAYNEGVAFSFPLTGVALKIVTVALIAYVAYYYFRVEKHRTGWIPAFYALVLA